METILSQWQRERSDIDASPMAVCGEIVRASKRLRQGILANVSNFDLDLAGFDVILTIRRQGSGETLSPSVLSEEMMLSTSAMTNRLERLKKRGLIARSMDPNDRRGIKVQLTDEGFALADKMVVSHVETEESMLSSLTEAERNKLRSLLTKIAVPPVEEA
ncbi:MAG: DNA-binding MarR family transcriptional regulator [Verrucomicrobiales bacterium]|jgi:DNA-binding MarR family transcriptional regulator